MSAYKDELRATRPIEAGDWICPDDASVPLARRRKKIDCLLILESRTVHYQESWEGGLYGVTIDRDEFTTIQVGVMPGSKYVRIVNDGRDLGLRIPAPLGLNLIAWIGGQAPFNQGT